MAETDMLTRTSGARSPRRRLAPNRTGSTLAGVMSAVALAFALATIDFLIQAQGHGAAPGVWCGTPAGALSGFLLFGHCATCWLHAAAVGFAALLTLRLAHFAAGIPALKTAGPHVGDMSA